MIIGVLEGIPQSLMMNMFVIHWHQPFDCVALELIREIIRTIDLIDAIYSGRQQHFGHLLKPLLLPSNIHQNANIGKVLALAPHQDLETPTKMLKMINFYLRY